MSRREWLQLATLVLALTATAMSASVLVSGRTATVVKTVVSPVTVTDTETVTGTVYATSTVTETATVTRTETRTVAVTSTIRETETVTRYLTTTSTVTVTKPITVTRTKTLTETVTVTKTVTETKTVTVAGAGAGAAGKPAGGGQPQPGGGEGGQEAGISGGYLHAILSSKPSPAGVALSSAGSIRAGVGSGYLYLERRAPYRGYASVEAVLEARDGAHLYLSPFRLEDGLTAVYSRISRERQEMYFQAGEVAAWLERHGGSGTLYYGDARCDIAVSSSGGLFLGSCSEMLTVEPPYVEPLYRDSYDTILDALVLGLDAKAPPWTVIEVNGSLLALPNVTEARLAALAVYGNTSVTDPAAASWRLLEFMDSMFKYNYTKQSLINAGADVGVYAPHKMLEARSGVCSDYAVFGAAALLGAGLDAYVLSMDLPGGPGHAAAAAAVGDALYVLDQHLPPVELSDYLEYVARGAHGLILYRATMGNGGVVVEEYLLDPLIEAGVVADPYPADRLEPGVVEEARAIVAGDTGMKPVEGLGAVMRLLGQGAYVGLTLPSLGGAVSATMERAPLDVAYSPVYRSQWARMLAGYAEDLINKYYVVEEAYRGGFWLDTGRGGGYLYVNVTASLYPINASARIEGGALVVEARLPRGLSLDPERDVQLLIYPRGGRDPCAGVTPPGYYYSNMPYVEARRWSLEDGRLVIEVDYGRLLAAARACSSPVAALWVKNSVVYALELG